MNKQKSDSPQKIYYYVQAMDDKTNNFLRIALGEDPIFRSPKEAVGAPVRFSFSLYLVPLKDVECFMQVSYISFNVFVRKEKESFPHFFMRKNTEIEKRNAKKEDPNGFKLYLVKKTKAPIVFKIVENSRVEVIKKREKKFPENPELAEKNAKRLEKVKRPEKRTLFLLPNIGENAEDSIFEKAQDAAQGMTWAKLLIIPAKDKSNEINEITFTYIRKALYESGLSIQSVYESGKINEKKFEHVWEANSDVFFKLWCYARRNSAVRFIAFRSKDGLFKNFKQVFYYSKSPPKKNESKVLQFR